jgi:hypothetical protein
MLIDVSKLNHFTSNGSVKKEMSPRDIHFLKGYRLNTLIGYNSVAKKFGKFIEEAGVVSQTWQNNFFFGFSYTQIPKYNYNHSTISNLDFRIRI